MSSTILMAIVLVVMWLVVLVPMFVRSGEDGAESGSKDRFATARRVLSRRAPGSDDVATRPRPATTTPGGYVEGVSPVRAAARARMLARRRRTLAVLAAITVVGVPAALAMSGWFWVAQVPATLLLVGYVGWLRQQVRREHERRARRRQLFAPAEHAVRRAAEAAAEVADRPRPAPTPSYVLAPAVRRRTETMIDLDDEDLSFTDLESYPDDDLDLPRAVNG